MKIIKPIVLFSVLLSYTHLQAQTIKLVQQLITKKASFRGLSVIDENIAWVSGSGGTVLTTQNGGEKWNDVSIAGAGSLDFRDIEAFNDKEAIVVSAGSPAKIYKTIDAGITWKETYSNEHPDIFYDAMGFWDKQNGIAFGDAMDNHLVIITTTNGGDSWEEIDYKNLPKALDGEGGFAASGTCLTTFGISTVWIGLGSPASRVFKSEDKGKSWSEVNTPMKSNKPTAGIFSLTFSSQDYGIAVGGDYKDDNNREKNVAISEDGGKTWNIIENNNPNGFRSVVANVPTTKWWLAAGTSGIDVSKDNGKTWELVSEDGYHTLAFGSKKVGWLSGSSKIAKITIE